MFKTKTITKSVDGIDNWIWPAEDTGLWDGPAEDWTLIKPHIEAYCNTRINAVQAGGGCGMYPKLLSKMFEFVYTFEPDPYNFYCLAQNCSDNNIYKFNACLGDRHRKVRFDHPIETNRGTGTITNIQNNSTINDTKGNVVMLKVDDFEFESLGLLYLDVEGSEFNALHGSINTIRKHKPLIICENGHNGLINLLEPYGYIIVERSRSDTIFRVADGTV